ncbi:MAG: RagB/SusD family nutrient uptake outer membrane protein [Bacteroidales bacterium]|nr:RagB/SusD family nutrient uptake outer membrane protein [Bacteroidales bacterium]
MYRIFSKLLLITGLVFVISSCTKDLNTIPLSPTVVTSATVYNDTAAYKQVLAKLYAGLATSGQQGPAGQPDISGIDEGFGEYLRGYWHLQELPTDEAVISWNDQTIHNFHKQSWNSSDVFITAFYSRVMFQVAQCNEFLRQTTDAKLTERGVSAELKAKIAHYRAEARFLRALSYYHALDLFGNVPFVTEKDPVGAFFPPQISRTDLFSYVESELKAIIPDLLPARTNEYGRADQGAAEFLLAKLYLNAKVYTGTERYTDCLTYCNKVINDGYALDSSYQDLFLADNNVNNPEVIFPIEFDGVHTQTWGGTTFIIHAAVGGSMNPADFGIDGGWAGTRTTSALVDLFNGVMPPSPSVKAMKAAQATYPEIYVPGGYQGWDPSTAPALASVNSDNTYEGYVNMDPAGEFKITAARNWDVAYGAGSTAGTLSTSGGNLSVTDAGYYKMNVDLTNMAYTMTKTTWSIIGAITPGGNWTTDMTYDPTTDTWSITGDFPAGDFKFRANHDWGLNYGVDNGNTLKENGGNLNIPTASNYTITLKLGTPPYTYTITQNKIDHRALFYTDGQSLEINDIGTFTDGYAVAKFKNVTSAGVAGKDLTFTDTDFPLFRLADVYLMYAEAVLRGGTGGDMATAVHYINLLRQRAYGNTAGDITESDLTLPFILNERGRELYWECTRRTDLIRFGEFTGDTYLWPWKGGVKDGIGTNSKYDLYPIPAADLSANPNLKQNTGY